MSDDAILSEAEYHDINAVKTECLNGHQYTPENTYIDKRGRRSCRTCRRIKSWSRSAFGQTARGQARIAALGGGQ